MNKKELKLRLEKELQKQKAYSKAAKAIRSVTNIYSWVAVPAYILTILRQDLSYIFLILGTILFLLGTYIYLNSKFSESEVKELSYLVLLKSEKNG